MTVPRTGGRVPSSRRSSVVLPAPDGPTMPVNWSSWTWNETSCRTTLLPVAGSHVVEADELGADPGAGHAVGRAHCGYSALSATGSVMSSASTVDGSPPSPRIIVA